MTLPVYADSLSRRLFYLLTIILLIKLGLDFIHLSDSRRIQFPGDHLPGVPPVPIPNTAVKPRAANGSRALGPARVGYCQVYDPDSAKAESGSSFLWKQWTCYRLDWSSIFPKRFSRKVLTGGSRNVWFVLFPLNKEMLFEIYFVRLIGTPNQKYIIPNMDKPLWGLS
jgi:hypothetical protein